MKIPCGYCRSPIPRLMLHRLGNRLLCGRCFNAIRNAPTGAADPGPVAPEDLRGLLKQTLLVAFGAVAGKAVFFLPLFFWARASEIGAGALRGAVAADIFSWIVFSLLDWPFRRVHVGLGGLFELALIVLYLNREPLFEIAGGAQTTALSLVFFFLVLFGKTALWTAERTLEVTGVKEPA